MEVLNEPYSANEDVVSDRQPEEMQQDVLDGDSLPQLFTQSSTGEKLQFDMQCTQDDGMEC